MKKPLSGQYLFHDVLGRKGDPGALAQQPVAAGAQVVCDPARQNEDFPSLFLDKRVWKGISVIPGCVEVLKKWHDKGHEIYFVTATNTENMYKKAEWLQRTFPFMDVKKNLICMQKKQMLGGNIDVLIDDCLNNLISGEYVKILLDYPWNRGFCPDSDLVIRCHNWHDIDKILKSLDITLDDNEE